MAKVRKDRAKPGRPDPADRDENAEMSFSLGGVFGKFGGMLEKLAELAKAGESFSRTGEIRNLGSHGKLRGVYGVSVKMGLGDRGEEELKIEPFGNVHQQPSGETVFEDVREPLVDVHEEDDHVLVLAELPGVSKKDVQVELACDRLTITAQRGEKRYHKEVVLPGSFSSQAMRWDCTNGILRIRLQR
jgi:HSP20 family protein